MAILTVQILSNPADAVPGIVISLPGMTALASSYRQIWTPVPKVITPTGKAAVVAVGSPAVEKVAVVEEAAGVVVVAVVEVVAVVRVAVAVLVIVLAAVPLPREEAGDAVDRVRRMARATPLRVRVPRARAAKVKVRAHRSPRAKAEVDRGTSSPVTARYRMAISRANGRSTLSIT